MLRFNELDKEKQNKIMKQIKRNVEENPLYKCDYILTGNALYQDKDNIAYVDFGMYLKNSKIIDDSKKRMIVFKDYLKSKEIKHFAEKDYDNMSITTITHNVCAEIFRTIIEWNKDLDLKTEKEIIRNSITSSDDWFNDALSDIFY